MHIIHIFISHTTAMQLRITTGFLHILSFIPYHIYCILNLLVLLICMCQNGTMEISVEMLLTLAWNKEKTKAIHIKSNYFFVLISRTKYTYLPTIKNLTSDLSEHKTSFNICCSYKFKY